MVPRGAILLSATSALNYELMPQFRAGAKPGFTKCRFFGKPPIALRSSPSSLTFNAPKLASWLSVRYAFVVATLSWSEQPFQRGLHRARIMLAADRDQRLVGSLPGAAPAGNRPPEGSISPPCISDRHLAERRVTFDLVAGDQRLDLLGHGLEQYDVEIGDADGAGASLYFGRMPLTNIAARFASSCTR
jgi:hypothetical protein